MKEICTKWSTVAAYAPTSNGKAERMVGTIERAVGKMAYRVRNTRDEKLPPVLYGYHRRHLDSGLSHFELMYGVTPRINYEPDTGENLGDATEEHLNMELMVISDQRAARAEKHNSLQNKMLPSRVYQLGNWYLRLADSFLLLLLSCLLSILGTVVPVRLSWKDIPLHLEVPAWSIHPF